MNVRLSLAPMPVEFRTFDALSELKQQNHIGNVAILRTTDDMYFINPSDVAWLCRQGPHLVDSTSRDMPTSAASSQADIRFSLKILTPPRDTTAITQSVIMDSTRDPEGPQTVPNPSVLVSRPSSSGPKLLELSGLPSESGVTGNMAQSFGDMGALAAVGLVAQAVDQGVLEREVATEVPFFSPPTTRECRIFLTVL